MFIAVACQHLRVRLSLPVGPGARRDGGAITSSRSGHRQVETTASLTTINKRCRRPGNRPGQTGADAGTPNLPLQNSARFSIGPISLVRLTATLPAAAARGPSQPERI